MKDRIKSYSFWTALSGAVVVLLQALGKCFGFAVNDEIISGIIMAVAGILVVLGIVTMPKNKTDEKDDSQHGELEAGAQDNASEEQDLVNLQDICPEQDDNLNVEFTVTENNPTEPVSEKQAVNSQTTTTKLPKKQKNDSKSL